MKMKKKLTSSSKQTATAISTSLPFASILATAVLMVIGIMLAMVVVALQSYHRQQHRAELQLLSHIQLIEQRISLGETIPERLPDGTTLFTPARALPPSLVVQLKNESPILLSGNTVIELGWQVFGLGTSVLVKRLNAEQLIVLPLPKRQITQQVMTVGLYLSLAVLAMMLIFSAWLHAKTQRRLQYISDTANAIVKGNLNKRIPINPAFYDEYSQLSQTLNAMLDKNAQLMQDLRQVNNNIAHDLKSPLNRMRSRMEAALIRSQDTDDYQQALAQSIGDVDALLKTFQSLLLMGSLDAKSQQYTLKPASLSALLEQLTELYQAVAEDANHHFSADIAADVIAPINAQLFAQAVSNLLDNAIKYTPTGGKMTLSLTSKNHTALIVIADNGPGIPSEQRQAVFKRFIRLDDARQLPGTGLGMSLVRSILRIHNASIQLHDNQPGLRIEIRLRTV